jgi:class 3 adenylate cyclase
MHVLGFAPVWAALTGLACMVTAGLVLLRAPEARAARPLFLALTSGQLLFGSSFFPGPPVQTYGTMLAYAVGSISVPFLLQAMLLLVPETAPRTRWGLWWPWAFAPSVILVLGCQFADTPFPGDVAWRWIEPPLWGAYVVGLVTILARSFRLAGPVGRRRIKWILYGYSLLYVPFLLQSVLLLLGWGGSLTKAPLGFVGMILPACVLIAVVRENLFDIDRLISVTASYTTLGVLALGIMLAGFSHVAARVGSGLGLEPAAAQLVLALGLAGVIVPAQRRLRPQVDRLFFQERYALERGVAELLQELSDCADPGALYARAGERLDALVRPESCVVYARTADAFAPAFTRGRIVPAFEPAGPLVAALAHRAAPLVADAWQRGRAGPLAPFDRATLETLGVAVVLPIRRRDELVAFVCLGAKRSGDIYTATDLALLNAVARKISDELIRFDLTDVVQRGRAMEEALRPYVPAAVAGQLASGTPVAAAEHQVSVLFVDIRGYTSFAEARESAEVFTTVSRYAETVSAIARDRGGAVAEFSGDGMMVVFGAPQALATKERAAVEAGREIIDAVSALPPDGPTAPPLSVGVGIATGPAFVGDVRSVDRRIWTAIGDTVNLAARLQQLTRAMDAAMVIDEPTWRGARYVAADFVPHARTVIRGRAEPEDVWVLPAAATRRS